MAKTDTTKFKALKNEPEVMNMEALAERLNRLDKTLADLPQAVSKAAGKAVGELMDYRENKILEHERKLKAEGKTSFTDYINSLTKRYDTVMDRYERVCDAVKGIFEIIQEVEADTTATHRALQDFGKKLDRAVHAQRSAPTMSDDSPAMPKSPKAVARYILRDLPLYQFKRLYRSRHVRQFIAILLLCSWLVSIGLTCIIAHDNAQLRKTEREYVMLRQWLQENMEKQANR